MPQEASEEPLLGLLLLGGATSFATFANLAHAQNLDEVYITELADSSLQPFSSSVHSSSLSPISSSRL